MLFRSIPYFPKLTIPEELSITITPNTIKQNELQIRVTKDTPIGQSVILTPEDIGTWKIVGEAITIITNKVPEGDVWYIRSIQTTNRITLENYPLENLDIIRDKILLTAGDVTFDISDTWTSALSSPDTHFSQLASSS